MPMTVVVTRNVESRVRGFLASTMLELAAGVYAAPNLTPAVRERIWEVLTKWRVGSRDDSALMTWPDAHVPGGLVVRTLGEPELGLHETPSVVLTRRPLSAEEHRSLTKMLDDPPF